jgi:dTDP-4-amino-4,6-dideoxygalactose transaminase
MNKLALLGGAPVRTQPFDLRLTLTDADREAARAVLDKGELSSFFGSPGPFFLGGEAVRDLEVDWAAGFGYRHAITVNSWTTGLMTAVGACGIAPGDEVICTPYSMSATATSILFYGGIPVFCDIEDETFNIDPGRIEALITPRTKAIMLVHLFGHPAEMDRIVDIARKHGLKVIEDAAHAPGARYRGRHVGALGDIGGFSLNYHKHIHSGEGGVLVTNDDDLALRCQLIRNHGENVIEHFGIENIANTIGANYRMTELQAAIALSQFRRLESCLQHRNRLHARFSEALTGVPGLTPPAIREHCTHSFYIYPVKYDEKAFGLPRQTFADAVNAELPKPQTWEQTGFSVGYIRPLYLNPIYQTQTALGNKGFPFTCNPGVRYDYSRGICPTAERMQDSELLICPMLHEGTRPHDLQALIEAVEKVYEHRHELQ